MPKQLLRNKETRLADKLDDQKTPTEIFNSETVSVTAEDFQEFIISQIRQITGTARWKDAVPVSLTAIADGASVHRLILTTAGGVVYDNNGEITLKKA